MHHHAFCFETGFHYVAVAAFPGIRGIYHHAGDTSVKNLFCSAESKEFSQDTKTK